MEMTPPAPSRASAREGYNLFAMGPEWLLARAGAFGQPKVAPSSTG